MFKVLSPEEIKGIFLIYFTEQYGEEAAKQLLDQLPDCNYAIAVAREALQDAIRQFNEMLDGIELEKYEDYYPTTTFTPRYQQARMAAWSKGQLRLLQTIKQRLEEGKK